LVISKFSCLETTSDQVVPWPWLRVELIDDGPESTSDPVADYCISDLATDRIAHRHWWLLGGDLYETD
jgi:hypothetical protein